MPFLILGIPMGMIKPKLEAFLPLIQRIEKQLVSTSMFLSQVGKLQLANSVFSAMPTIYMCSLKLPSSIITQIDKYRKHCLWRGADINARKLLQAGWALACKPKKQGGLGILHLEKYNVSLLMKNMHKFYNR